MSPEVLCLGTEAGNVFFRQHLGVSVDFPDDPVAKVIEENLLSPPRAAPESSLWPGHTFRVRCSSWLACVVSRTHMREYGSYPEAAWAAV